MCREAVIFKREEGGWKSAAFSILEENGNILSPVVITDAEIFQKSLLVNRCLRYCIYLWQKLRSLVLFVLYYYTLA